LGSGAFSVVCSCVEVATGRNLAVRCVNMCVNKSNVHE
jgi:hypothetical protein